jgi:hypothetical protein
MRSGKTNPVLFLRVKPDDLYTAAFLAALPVCLNHYYRRLSNNADSASALLSGVEEALTVAAIARKKWLAEKEQARHRGGYSE